MSKIEKQLSKRIKVLREQDEYSQEELAELLKIKRVTLSQIENGKRGVSPEELKSLSEIFNVTVDNLLGLAKLPEVNLPRKEKTERKEKLPIRINVPQKNLEKFKEVFLYILNKVGSKANIGETVIYKLLYFIDFDYYEKYEEQLIGASYQKNISGPTPMEFGKITEKMIKEREIIKVKDKFFNFRLRKYLPLRGPDLKKLKANEIKLIDDVLDRLSDMTAAKITHYSHKDVPWLTTEDEKIIEYESVFYRTQPYSVREYSEDIQ